MASTVNPPTIPISNIRNAAKGSVIIECNSKSSSVALAKDVTEKLGPNYSVKVPVKRNPKIKIIGISEELQHDTIKASLLQQNKDLFKDGCKLVVVHSFKTLKSFGVKLELDYESFQKVMANPKVRIGWDICNVYEAFDLVRCFNCCGYHHIAKNCTEPTKCSKCSGDHKLNECTSILEKCTNCSSAAESLKISIDITHSAMSLDCPVYLRKINLERKRTNYCN